MLLTVNTGIYGIRYYSAASENYWHKLNSIDLGSWKVKQLQFLSSCLKILLSYVLGLGNNENVT